jgi:hypothetical protein
MKPGFYWICGSWTNTPEWSVGYFDGEFFHRPGTNDIISRAELSEVDETPVERPKA